MDRPGIVTPDFPSSLKTKNIGIYFLKVIRDTNGSGKGRLISSEQYMFLIGNRIRIRARTLRLLIYGGNSAHSPQSWNCCYWFTSNGILLP
jgi:hypothetical protein